MTKIPYLRTIFKFNSIADKAENSSSLPLLKNVLEASKMFLETAIEDDNFRIIILPCVSMSALMENIKFSLTQATNDSSMRYAGGQTPSVTPSFDIMLSFSA